MAIKTRRITCAHCGQRETILCGERGPVTVYCDVCREERKREQARLRMQVMRERRRLDIKRTIISDHVPAQRGVKRVRF